MFRGKHRSAGGASRDRAYHGLRPSRRVRYHLNSGPDRVAAPEGVEWTRGSRYGGNRATIRGNGSFAGIRSAASGSSSRRTAIRARGSAGAFLSRRKRPHMIRSATCAPETPVRRGRRILITPARSSSTTITRRPDPPRRSGRASTDRTRARPAKGHCRVACFHPRHDLTLARMDVAGIRNVRWDVAGRIPHPRRGTRRESRPHLREQGRRRRGEQPAPALPDLRNEFRLRPHRRRGPPRPRAPQASRCAALPVRHRPGDRRRSADHCAEPFRNRLRAVFRALLV